MAAEEPVEVTAAVGPREVIELLRSQAPWLFAPELGTCLVGSQALAFACDAAGICGPKPGDIDLAWALEPTAANALLQQHGVLLPTTVGNVDRGTVAMTLRGRRLEVTTFRGAATNAPLAQRIVDDLGERDMTIGAVAVRLADLEVFDPHDGRQHWRERRIVPVGDAAQRVREHAVRWLRYYRKAHELGFELANAVRKIELDPALLKSLPREAVARELRAMLLNCASPGRCLAELHEADLLATLSPELARQFDGRPAGPQRWHPEMSQALHLILALEWAAAHTRHLDERDRATVLVATLCHDLGKGYTEPDRLPQHIGHERGGVPHVRALLQRWPSLSDQRGARVAVDVCELHVQVRQFDELRNGSLAELYDRHFRAKDYPLELFALAVAADSAGRLGHEADGEVVLRQVLRNLQWLRAACETVDAAELREQCGSDLARFRARLHEARAHALAAARRSHRE